MKLTYIHPYISWFLSPLSTSFSVNVRLRQIFKCEGNSSKTFHLIFCDENVTWNSIVMCKISGKFRHKFHKKILTRLEF